MDRGTIEQDANAMAMRIPGRVHCKNVALHIKIVAPRQAKEMLSSYNRPPEGALPHTANLETRRAP